MSQKTRSTLTINAVAQAAAAGVASALNPLNQPRTLAALVLRLFRSQEPSPARPPRGRMPGYGQGKARVEPECGQSAANPARGEAEPLRAPTQKGGPSHGPR